MTLRRFPVCLILVAAIGLTACQATRPPSDGPGDPDLEHARLRDAWLSAPGNTLHAGAPKADGGQTRSRAFVRRQVQNLVFRHPDHAPSRLLAGITAYESNDPVEATQHLDHALMLQPANPEAAMLRARIALEEGNPPYAVRLLGDQVRLRPDHAGLREMYASALAMHGDVAGGYRELGVAEALGASPARIAYNRGLLAEQEGDVTAAQGHYQQALVHAPAWNRPAERLAGLQHGSSVPAQDKIAFAPERTVVPLPPPPLPASLLAR